MSKIVNPNAFREESRRRLLDQYFAAYERLIDADLDGREDSEAQATVSRLWDEYLNGLPVVELSRNPFTSETFSHSIDIYGLDGLWWNSENATRPMEPLPPSVVAFCGAVSLAEPAESVPFVCKPGPGVPFIVPRILNQQGVKAVLSAVPVGKHKGYAVVYFAETELDTLEGMGDWGRTIAYYDVGDDDFGWQEWIPSPADFDFDLLPWIRKGKLLWIAPDDDSLTIRADAECPYLSVLGNRFCQVVQEGKIWEDHLYEEGGEVDEFEADEDFEPQVATKPAEPSHPVVEPPVAQPVSAPPVSTPPVQQTRFCRKCGGQLKPTAKFCPKCGTPTSK